MRPNTAEIEGKSSLIAITIPIVTNAIMSVLVFIFMSLYRYIITREILVRTVIRFVNIEKHVSNDEFNQIVSLSIYRSVHRIYLPRTFKKCIDWVILNYKYYPGLSKSLYFTINLLNYLLIHIWSRFIPRTLQIPL